MIAGTNIVEKDKYPYLFEAFGEALAKISIMKNRDMYPLWWIIRDKDEAYWEEILQNAANILRLKNPEVFRKAYELSPNDYAGRAGRFSDFKAEIVVLFTLHDKGFTNIEKLKTKQNFTNPDYVAVFGNDPFTVEVCNTDESKEEEFVVLNGYVNAVPDIPVLLSKFEQMIEQRLNKFERQLSVFPNRKRLAAMTFGWPAVSALIQEDQANSIATGLIQKAKGKIDFVLIVSTLRTATFLYPKLSGEE